MFLFPTGCDVDGMSGWERCTTVMGNPAFSVSEESGLANQFDILIPLALGFLAGLVTSWAAGIKDHGPPVTALMRSGQDPGLTTTRSMIHRQWANC